MELESPSERNHLLWAQTFGLGKTPITLSHLRGEVSRRTRPDHKSDGPALSEGRVGSQSAYSPE